MVSKPYSMDFRLDGKVAVITGAASGIGYAAAELFSMRGAVVCLLDVNLDAAKAAAKELTHAEAIQVDIADKESINQAVSEVLTKFGKIDILINSAGVGDIEWAETISERTWRKVIDVNLSGTFLMSQRVGQEMICAGQGGKIISLASQAGIVAIDKHVAYSASKAGIISLTQSLAFEWGKYGIQVNSISPTATETPIIEGYWTEGEIHDAAIANTPAGRFCKPQEIAAAALFLACGASNMVTGSNLVVDGGYTIH